MLASFLDFVEKRLHKIFRPTLSESFVPTFRFEKLEIHKVFLRFPNLNLEQNLSLIALGDLIRVSLSAKERCFYDKFNAAEF